MNWNILYSLNWRELQSLVVILCGLATSATPFTLQALELNKKYGWMQPQTCSNVNNIIYALLIRHFYCLLDSTVQSFFNLFTGVFQPKSLLHWLVMVTDLFYWLPETKINLNNTVTITGCKVQEVRINVSMVIYSCHWF